MTSRLRRQGSPFIRGSIAYMSVGLIQRAIGFALLPIYARVLTPEDYGTVALLVTLFGGTYYLMSFGLEVAIFRSYFLLRDTPAELRRYVNTLGLFLFVAPATLVLGIAFIIRTVFRNSGIPFGLLVLELVSAAIYIAATVVPLAIIRARESLSDYVVINCVYAFVQVVLKAIFILGFDLGIQGWVLSDLLATLAMLAASQVFLRHRWSLEFDRHHLFAALSLGLPFLPHLVAHWTLSLSDRLVLAALLDARQVGVYSMGYQFGLLLGIVLNETNRAVLPAYGRAASTRTARRLRLPKEVSSTATVQILLTTLLGASTALIAPPVMRLILPPAYLPAIAVIPSIALGYVFYGWYYVPMNIISVIAGDTKFVAIPTIVAAGMNVVLNFWLVPKWGILAAGVNTAISYGFLLVMVGLYKRVRVPGQMELHWGRLVGSTFVVVLIYAAASVVLPSMGPFGIATRLLAMLLAAVVVFLRHRDETMAYLSRPPPEDVQSAPTPLQ